MAAQQAADGGGDEDEQLELLRDVSALVEQAKGEQKSGKSFVDAMLSILKPVERYAVRWLDEVEPIIDMNHQEKVGASIEQHFAKEEWKLEELEEKRETLEKEAVDGEVAVLEDANGDAFLTGEAARLAYQRASRVAARRAEAERLRAEAQRVAAEKLKVEKAAKAAADEEKAAARRRRAAAAAAAEAEAAAAAAANAAAAAPPQVAAPVLKLKISLKRPAETEADGGTDRGASVPRFEVTGCKVVEESTA